MSPEVAKYCKRAIIDYMAGNIEEYERLVNKAIEFNKTEDELVKCKYWHKGKKVDAQINFSTGVITSKDGEVLRGKMVC